MTLTRLINHYKALAWLFVLVAGPGLLVGCSTYHNLFGQPSHLAAAPGDEIAGRLRTGDAITVRLDTGGATPASALPSEGEDRQD